MTVAMPFLQKLITFLWPPDIPPLLFAVFGLFAKSDHTAGS